MIDQIDESPPPNQSKVADYNTVFERLSGAASPLAGAVAYALYKNAKRQWIQEFRDAHGHRPSDDEHKHHTATQTEAVLNAYLSQADQILAQYAEDIIKEERPRILAEALKGDFWRSFWTSYWASVAFAATLLLVVLVALFFGFGLPVQFNIPAKSSVQLSN